MSEIFHPEDPGGQGRQAFDLAAALCAQHCEVRVLTRRHYAASSKRDRLDAIAVRRLPPVGLTKGNGWRALWPTLVFLSALTWALLRDVRRYDTILVHGVKLILVPPLLIALLFGKRVIAKVDATAELDQAITAESLERMKLRHDSPLIRLWGRLRRRLLRGVDLLIAISGEVREALLRTGVSSGRVIDLPNGLDLQRWQPASSEAKRMLREQLALPEGPLLVFVGRLSRAKGVLTLLESWLSLCAEHPDAHLLIVGSGSVSHDDCATELHARHRASPHRERVIFTGQVSNVHDYLRASDVFVQCSEHEGFGLALVEAMACGLAVVTTPVGAARDVIQPGVNGMLVPIGDAAALTTALRSLLNDPHRWPALGAAAHQTVVGRYDLHHIARRYLPLLDPQTPLPRAALQVPR